MRTLLVVGLMVLVGQVFGQQTPRAYRAPEFSLGWDKATRHPDHVVLNPTEDASSGMSVSWRTSAAVTKGYAEIAPATGAPKFWRKAVTIPAESTVTDLREVLEAEVINVYHTATFSDLEPNTVYAYRVGDGDVWSEWYQFRTPPPAGEPFSFLYVGDAQNYILELWSRLIREGYRTAPEASFIIHAGDLVNTAHNEQQWHEWFTAGGFIHAMLPSIPVAGNHEQWPRNKKELDNRERHLSAQWQPQFNLPLNGPANLDTLAETVYYVDYPDTRVIVLNTNKFQAEQIPWLDSLLAATTQKWKIVTYHHPLYSASEGRDNERLRNAWKPIFDKHKVDIALQGHDHAYARGRTDPPEENLVVGMNMRDYTGTAYVVSVSGGKMYNMRPDGWDDFPGAVRNRGAENTQLFQVLTIDGDTLRFESYTATGELYDAFDLVKEANRPNRFIERKSEAIPERRHDNTIAYYDQLPEDLEADILEKYVGFEIRVVTYVDEDDFHGYIVRLYHEKDRKEVNLWMDTRGNVLEERIRQR